MRKIIASILLLSALITLIAIGFTFIQVEQEEKRLRDDLQYRSTLVADGLRGLVETNFISLSPEYLQTVVERYADRTRAAGIVIVDNKNIPLAATPPVGEQVEGSLNISADVMDSDKAYGTLIKSQDKTLYVFAVPVRNETNVVGSVLITQSAGYIDTQLIDIWKASFIRLLTQVLIISTALLIILRWIVYEPVRSLVESLKLSRLGITTGKQSRLPSFPFFKPLTIELSNIQRSLTEARHKASEEARLRLKKIDTPWTEERLKEFLKDTLRGRKIYVVSNREPYIHTRKNGNITHFFPASGMATAIEPIMQACGGTWIAHGSGNADREVVDRDNRIAVPPNEPKYTLRRVWLTKEEEKGYYYGFSNEGIWPLCHLAHARPIFRKEDWEQYQKVNGEFTKAVLQEIKGQHKPIIFVQDYHFALLPRMIKASRPDAVIGLFWHIPWPNPESFSICPFRKPMLEGMLGADVIGFHTQLHCNNFIDTIGKEVESLIDWERFAVTTQGHTTLIKPFPISIAFYESERHADDDTQEETQAKQAFKDLNIKEKFIGLGVDRLDYTKGILERFKAIEVFLDKFPSYRKQFTFVQIAPKSRADIASYKEYGEDVEAEVKRVNSKFASDGWTPIRLLTRQHSHMELNEFYRHADICLVTSLHDGMNLVAKEYIAARDDEQGVLILSKFTGASRELKDALIINPYDPDEVAERMNEGFKMMKTEKMKRMRKMRESIKQHNVYRWSAEVLKSMADLE